MWCLAHRAELAIKDALKSSTFDQIDDMIYFGYITFMMSPKKCRELEGIISYLKQFL